MEIAGSVETGGEVEINSVYADPHPSTTLDKNTAEIRASHRSAQDATVIIGNAPLINH